MGTKHVTWGGTARQGSRLAGDTVVPRETFNRNLGKRLDSQKGDSKKNGTVQ